MGAKRNHRLASERLEITRRREAVAEARLKGYTEREICQILADNKIVNPKTGKAYSPYIIHKDLEAIEENWVKRTMASVETRKAQQDAEIQLLKREAWKSEDFQTVSRAQDREAKLLGLDAPSRQEVSGPGGGPIEIARSIADMTTADLLDLVRRCEMLLNLDIQAQKLLEGSAPAAGE